MRFLLTLALALPVCAATVDGINLHWSSAGRGTKALILVHGWTCDETSWAANIPALSQHFRVIALDLPGHGRSGSPKDGNFSMDLFARAVEAVRAAAGVDRVVLVGHSMGTPVIRQYARLYPQHVAAMILVDGLVTSRATRGGDARPQFTGNEGMKARETMVKGMFTPATPAGVQEHVLKMMLGAPEATANGAMAATVDPTIWKDDVMTMPVLGIYADKSRLANPEYSKKIYPSFEYVEVPKTGHFVMMEKPEEFDRLVTTFVDKIKY